jgi:hypothetical protein
MGIMKKIRRWLRDPRRSPVRKPVNQRSPVPSFTTHSVTATVSEHRAKPSAGNTLTERDDISRRMKEMVDRSTRMRDTHNIRSPQHLSDYEERVMSRLARVPTRNPRTNTRHP